MSTGLIGREQDRRRLQKALHDPDIGAVILSGPAGAGKSALAQTVLSELVAEGGLVGMGKYAEGEARLSFGPIVEAFAEVVSSALDQLYDPTAGLESLSQALGPAAAVLFHAGFRPPGLQVGEAHELAGHREGAVRLISALLRVVDWLQGFGLPMALVVDDWRRAAPEVRRLLLALLARSGETNLTLMLTERDDVLPDALAARPDVLEIELGELGDGDRRELFVQALDSSQAADAVIAWLGPDCPRLPFDILEAARRVQESGALRRTRAGLAIDPARLAEADRPDLAHSIVRRLDESSPEARRLALVLALWGDSARIQPLAGAAGFDPAQLEAAASRLQAAGLLRLQGEELQFRHDRLRAGVLAASTAEEHRILAGELAERLVGLPGLDSRLRGVALRLRLQGGLEHAAPEAWRDRFARGAAEARAQADEQSANAYAEAAWRLGEQAPPADPAAERLILREGILAAADRQEPELVGERARRLVAVSEGESALGEAYELGITALRLAGDFARSWAIGREGSARLGLRLPERARPLDLVAAAVSWRLKRLLGSLTAQGTTAQAPSVAFTRVAHATAATAYERDAPMSALVALKALALLPRAARAEPYWLAVQAFVCSAMGEYEAAARLGELAASSGGLTGHGGGASLYRAIYWGVIWRRPLAELRSRCTDVRDQAIAEGDLVTAATALRNSMMLGWRTVPSLQVLDREIVALERELEWLGEPAAKVQAFELRRIVARLRDRTAAPLIRLAEDLAKDAESHSGSTRPRAVLALEVASLSGDWSAAMDLLRGLAPLKSTFDSHPGGVIWRFHEGIYRLKTGRALRRADLAYVRRAAELNPADHRHKLLVLQAERLRSRGKPASLGAYAVAVDAACASSFRLEAGVTAQLAAEAARDFGHPELAERYLARAQEIWSDWGALAKLGPEEAPNAHALPQILEAQAQAAAARRDDRAKSRLLADVAHELRTPLQGMQGLLDLAAQDGSAMDLDAFREVFASLKVVIDDLTDYGALSSGEAPSRQEPTTLAELVRSEFSVAVGHPALGGARLELDIAEDLPPAVATDPSRVRQVIRNLLSNAAKYGGGAFVRLAVAQAGTNAAGEARLIVAVEDSGPGLREGDALLIFEPFERGARHGDGKGLGLGLALSRKIARRLGGDLVAENRRGGGARFVFSFVAQIVETAPEPEPALALGRLRILLAEDVELSRRVIAALLRREGHEVVEAQDGTQALAEAARGGFDLLILDMSMPGASGVDVLRGLGGAREAKTILLTASSSEDVAADALEAGVGLVLRKPLSAVELGRALSALFQAPAREEASSGIAEELRQLAEAARVELRERVELLNRRQARRSAGDNAAEAHRIAGLAAQFGLPAIADQAEAVERAFKAGGRQAKDLARELAASVRALEGV